MADQSFEMEQSRTRAAAAQYLRDRHHLRVSNAYLAQLASEGTGPPYRLVQGRAFYCIGDLDAWADSLIGNPVRRASDARRADATEAA